MTTRNDIDEELATEYLLGRLDEEPAAAFEAMCFADEALAESLDALRDELVDRYVLGDLSRHEKEGFESHFMSSPYQARKVEFTRSLVGAIGPTARRSRRSFRDRVLAFVATPPRWTVVLAASFLVAVVSYAAYRALRAPSVLPAPPPDIAHVEPPDVPTVPPSTEDPSSTNASNAPPLENRPVSGPPRHLPSVLTVAFAGVTRSFDTTPVRISPSIREIRFLPESPDVGYDSYAATLTTLAHREVWRASVDARDAGKRRKTVTVVVPTNAIPGDGTYVLSVVGTKAGVEESLVEKLLEISGTSKPKRP